MEKEKTHTPMHTQTHTHKCHFNGISTKNLIWLCLNKVGAVLSNIDGGCLCCHGQGSFVYCTLDCRCSKYLAQSFFRHSFRSQTLQRHYNVGNDFGVFSFIFFIFNFFFTFFLQSIQRSIKFRETSQSVLTLKQFLKHFFCVVV